MTYPLVRDLAADGFPVRLTCGVLGFSAQAFYAWNENPATLRDLEDAYAINAIINALGDDPVFSYRFLVNEPERAGIDIGEKRAWRLCFQQKLSSSNVKNGRKGKRPGPPVNDDLLRRDFTAAQPNRKWVTALHGNPTAEGKIYCCVIRDLFSNWIVGYAISDRMTADLAEAVLRVALARREPDEVVIVHADRGSQSCARSFKEARKAAGHQGSMGCVISAGDNTALESFGALCQRNVMNIGPWRTREELGYAITYGIEHTYKMRRRQFGPG